MASISDLARLLETLRDAPNALTLVLDGITDVGNIGAIIRSANLFEVDLVISPYHRSAGRYTTIERSSVGARAHVRQVKVSNISRAIATLKSEQFWVYGAAEEGKPVETYDLTGRLAIVMGDESRGLARLTKSNCDELLAISSGGEIHSFNVSVATGIMLYEARRQQNYFHRRPPS